LLLLLRYCVAAIVLLLLCKFETIVSWIVGLLEWNYCDVLLCSSSRFLNCKTSDMEIIFYDVWAISVMYGLYLLNCDVMTFIFLCHVITTSDFHLTWHFAMWRGLKYYDK
jgi:hypothetical protein